SGNLRQGQVHKDDATFYYVHPQVGVDAGQNQAGEKRRQQKWKDLHGAPLFPLFRRVECLDQQTNIVIEELKIIIHSLFTAYRRQIDDNLGAGFPPDRLRGLEIKIRLNQHDSADLELHQLDKFKRM